MIRSTIDIASPKYLTVQEIVDSDIKVKYIVRFSFVFDNQCLFLLDNRFLVELPVKKNVLDWALSGLSGEIETHFLFDQTKSVAQCTLVRTIHPVTKTLSVPEMKKHLKSGGVDIVGTFRISEDSSPSKFGDEAGVLNLSIPTAIFMKILRGVPEVSMLTARDLDGKIYLGRFC